MLTSPSPTFSVIRGIWSRWSSNSLRCILSLVVLHGLAPATFAQVQMVPAMRTAAGTGTLGYSGDGAVGLNAQISMARAVAVDTKGNLYIADTDNHVVRKVDRQTGLITTVAGNGTYGQAGDGGSATSATLSNPSGVAVDKAGNIFIADTITNRIRRVDAVTGRISLYAGDGYGNPSGDGGQATAASVYKPAGLALDAGGNLFIADNQNHRIRRIDATTHIITTVAGNGNDNTISGDGGAATSAKIGEPLDVAVDAAGNLYIVAAGHDIVRKVTASTGRISSVAGNPGSVSSPSNGDGGTASSAYLPAPVAVEVDADGNLYITENASGIRGVRKVDASTGIITTVVGGTSIANLPDDIAVTNSALESPYGLAIDAAGYIYFEDWYRIRKVDPATGSALFPTTPVSSSSAVLKVFLQLTSAQAIQNIAAVPSQGNVTEYSIGTVTGCIANGITSNAANTICTVPITFKPGYPGTRNVPLKVVTSTGTYYTGLSGLGTGPQIAFTAGTISTLAGDGTGGYAGDGGSAASAKLKQPYGVTTDKAGNLYISDTQNLRVRKVDAATGAISTIAGNGTFGFSGDGGPATSAQISFVFGSVKVDDAGNIFIPDTTNNRVRRVDAATGIITTIAGGGNGFGNLAINATLLGPRSVAIDGAGNLYIGDAGNGIVRRVAASTGIITTIAGSVQGFGIATGVPATSALLFQPSELALDSKGNLYIADAFNFIVRKVDAITGIIATVAGKRATSQASNGDGGLATDATFDGPFGIALDAADNLYITDGEHASGSPTTVTNNRIRKVDAATGIIHTIAGVGPGDGTVTYSGDGGPATEAAIAGPNGIALDSLGNIYFADTNNNAIRKIDVNATSLTFASTQVGATSTDSPKVASLSNIGNDPLYTLIPGAGRNPSISPSFTLSSSETTACPVLSNFSFIPSHLDAGASCTVTVGFVPQAAGTIHGTLSFTGNALNASPGTVHSIAVHGVGTNPAAVLTFAVANHTYGDTPFTVLATSNSTGAITYSVVSGPATLSGNTVTLTGIGTVLLKASQVADANHADVSKTASFDVLEAPSVLVFTVADHAFGDAPFTVAATSSSTGTITYAVQSGPATIAGNTVTLIGAGTVTLKATQAASGNYAAGTKTASFNVAAIAPDIAFSIATHTFGDAPFAVAATSNSSGAISYTLLSGPATFTGSTLTLTGPGDVTVQASQVANGNYLSGTRNASFHVNQATLVITANNATRVYGAPNPAFTGTITGAVNGDVFTESFSTTATLNSAVNTYAIVPSAAGTHLAVYAQSIHNGTLTVTKAASVTSLSASSTAITPGAGVTLNAQVISRTTGTPTGAVTFFDGATSLGASPVTGGTASLLAAKLTPGASHVITATYSGDGNFTTSNSSAPTGIDVAPLEFSISSTGSTSQTVIPGESANFSFAVSPKYGVYPAAVSFAVTGLPAKATCFITPATLSANSGPQTVTVRIVTAPVVAMQRSTYGNRGIPLAAVALLLLPLSTIKRLRRSGSSLMRCALLCIIGIATLATAASLSGCGSGYGSLGQSAKDYAVTITATSGSVQHTSTVNLNAQ